MRRSAESLRISCLRSLGLRAIAIAVVLLFASQVAANEPVVVDGFTAPYRMLHIGAPEAGILEQVLVQEGDVVREGDVLAKLDCDVHLALLEIAKKSMELEGKLKSTQAELAMRERRFNTIERLHSEGHARREELERARADRDIAAGNLLSAQEELLLKRLEHDKIIAQIERRKIRAPIDGVVTALHKHQGEFAAPNDPEILVLVQLDPLLADFSVSWLDASHLEVGQKVTVQFDESGRTAKGVVDFVSPLTDAESGTVPVKVRLDNAKGHFRSGDRCVLQLPASK